MRLLRGACAHLPSPPLGSLGPDLLRRIRISVGFDLRAQVDRLDDEVGGGNLQRQFGQTEEIIGAELARAKVISDHLYERESALSPLRAWLGPNAAPSSLVLAEPLS